MIERIRQVQSLVHKELSFFTLRRNRKCVLAKILQARCEGAGR
jgi:hypothetical protein